MKKMASERRESSSSSVMEGDVTVAADGVLDQMDDQTVITTPRPLAASTVVKMGRKSDRYLIDGVRGSFLDDTASSNYLSAKKSLSTKLEMSGEETNSRRSLPMPNLDESVISSRSSLGLLPAEAMLGDLSSSILHVSTGPKKKVTSDKDIPTRDKRPPVPRPASQNTSRTSQNTSRTSQNISRTSQNTSRTSQNTSRTSQNTLRTNITSRTSATSRSLINLSSGSDHQGTSLWLSGSEENKEQSAPYKDTPRPNLLQGMSAQQRESYLSEHDDSLFGPDYTLQEQKRRLEQSRRTNETISSQSESIKSQNYPWRSQKTSAFQNKTSAPPLSQTQGQRPTQGQATAMTALFAAGPPGGRVEIAGGGGMAFGGQADMDASVVEVEINEDELKQFDEEFSDIGDIDTTLAEEAPPGSCDLRTELLMAETSQQEENSRFHDSCDLNPSLLASVDLNTTPSFLRQPFRQGPRAASPDTQPDVTSEERPDVTGDVGGTGQPDEGSMLDDMFLRQASQDLTGEDMSTISPGEGASINFAASTRINQGDKTVTLDHLGMQPKFDGQEAPESISSTRSSDLFHTASTVILADHTSIVKDQLSSSKPPTEGSSHSINQSKSSFHHMSDGSGPIGPSSQDGASSHLSNSIWSHQGTSLTFTPGGETRNSSEFTGSLAFFSPDSYRSLAGDGLVSDSPPGSATAGLGAVGAYPAYREGESQRERDWGQIFASQGWPQRGRQDARHRPLVHESANSSNIDTDDEIAAVRLEMSEREKETRRQRGVGSGNVDAHGSRPGLEGGSSEENDTPALTRSRSEARQSAEGDVMASPVMGDGGGGGDGSSGHGSDDNATPVAPHSGHVGSQTTLDVLRSLGFSGMSPLMVAPPRGNKYAPFEEDNPEAQQRIRPMGDDLLSAQRHVRFASPTTVRGPTRGGASGRDDSGNLTPEDDADSTVMQDSSHFASQFLAPSSAAGFSMSQSLTPGLDQSSFNLSDLVRQHKASQDRSGANPSHWDPGDGQENEEEGRRNQVTGEDETDALDFTFSRKVSFGAAANLSQLLPSGSPVSERGSGGAGTWDRPGGKDSSALWPNQDSINQEAQFRGESSSCLGDELYTETPGAGDMTGPLRNPFDTSDGVGFGNQNDSFNFGDEDFMSADQAKAMIADTEQEFEQENVFLQADDLPDSRAPSLGMPDSWSYHSTLDITKPSWMSDSSRVEDTPTKTPATCQRISIATFMGSRSAALGSLSGDPELPRPSFGTSSVTSPEQQRPVALLPASSLSDIYEQASRASDDVRGSGVGSDVDTEAADTTLQADELETIDRKELHHNTPDPSRHQAHTFSHVDQPSNCSTPNVSVLDSSEDITNGATPNVSEINISAITNLISSTSSTARPEDLANMIMMMSSSKYSGQQKQHSTGTSTRQKPEPKTKDVSRVTKAPELPVSDRCHDDDRRPDGKSDQSQTSSSKVTTDSATRAPGGRKQDKKQEVTSSQAKIKQSMKTSNQGDIDVLGNTSSSSKASSSGRSRPSPPPVNGHTKIPLFKWHDQSERRKTSEHAGKDKVASPTPSRKLPGNKTNKPGKNSSQMSDKNEDKTKSKVLEKRVASENRTKESSKQTDRQSERKNAESRSKSDPAGARSVNSGEREEVPGQAGEISCKNQVTNQEEESDALPGDDTKSDFDDSNVSLGLSEKWKSPRPSMMMSRSRRDDVHYEDTFGESIPWEMSPVKTSQVDETRDLQSTLVKQPDIYRNLLHEMESDVSSQNDQNDLQLDPLHKPTDSWRRNLRPDDAASTTETARPTLLTSKSLLTTPFAQKYLSNTKTQTKVAPCDPKMGLSSDQKMPLQSMSIVSDQFNVEDPHTRPKHKLNPASVINDQLNTDDVSVSLTNAQSASLISDQWSPGHDRCQATKENQPPERQSQSPGVGNWLQTQGGQRVETFPPSRNSLSRNSNHSNKSAGNQGNNSKNESSMVSPRPMSGRTPTPRVAVETPLDLRIEETCCIGLSVQATLPLRNPTERWLHVNLHVVTVEINGQPHPPERVIPFIMKEKVIIEPRTTEDVKVIFSPRSPGVYVSQLHVIASPVWSDQPTEAPSNVPTMVTLQAVAERPNIEVLSDESHLDFGALPWGCQKGLHLFLLNRGRANIPVRLAIASNKSASQYFTFEGAGGVGSDSSIISLTRPPSYASLAPSVLNLTLPGATLREETMPKPTPVTVCFRAPPAHPDRSPVLGAPEEFSARLDIDLDTPSSQISIASLGMMAAAGTVRLHAPRDMEVVQFTCGIGSSQSRVVPLRNAGNVPIDVLMEVTHWPDLFTVQPSTVRINPGHQQDILVQFTPSHTTSQRFDSLLLMFVEPGGSGYEISLCGLIQSYRPPPHPGPSPHPSGHTPNTRGPAQMGSLIMSNKHYLAWGGVPLGKALEQGVTIQNNTDEHLRLRLLIRGHAHTFQLQSSFTSQRQGAEGKELVLQPREEYNVRVLFAPTSIAHFKGKLQMKPVPGTSKYSIPLSGYGGTSSLVWDGVERGQSGSYWTNLGPINCSQPAVVKSSVRNSGTRMAYVKALCFHDLGCRQQMPDERVLIQPSSFCLPPDSTQDIAIVIKPSEREAAMCLHQTNIVATVALFYGDEVSRHKYRRSVTRSESLSGFKLSENNPVRDVNFNTYLAGEERYEEGVAGEDTPNDLELFYSTMSKATLACIGEPPSNEQPDILKATPTISHKEKSSISPLTKNPCGPADISSFGSGPHPAPEDWYIKPEQIILNATTKDCEVTMKRVQLVNCSDLPLQYELLWPGRVLTVTPEQGTVPPKSSMMMCVNANSTLYSKGVHLPWRGQILVDGQGDSKVLKVQVREGVTSDDSPLHALPLPLPLPAEPGTPLVTMTSPSPLHPTDVLKLSHKTVHFPETTVHRCAELSLDITNVSESTVKWYLSLFAPPYIKVSKDHNATVCRATYTVFKFPHHYGVLGPGQQTKVAVTFSPRDAGHYSQFWTLKADIQGQGQGSSLTKVELLGLGALESSPESVGSLSKTTLLSGTLSHDVTKHGRADRVAEISPAVLEFPNLKPGESRALKVQLKNRDTEDCCFHVEAPREPFSTKFTTIRVRSRHYVRWQIVFTPSEPGTYHGVVLLKTDSGRTLSVQLVGNCKL